jgi:hypothetical protein
LVFEVWPEFPFISERSAIRDFSRLSSSTDLHRSPVQNEYGALRSSHAREAASPDPRVRILPPHQPHEAFYREVATSTLRCECVKQSLSLLQIARVEAFGEPAVDRSEELTWLIPLT